MNATDKQIEYVQKLAAWKGKAIDFNDIKSKTVEQVSQLIDELKALKSVKETQTPAKAVVNGDFNKVRFGLACKIAWQRVSANSMLPSQAEYNSAVSRIYRMMCQAEKDLFPSSAEASK